MSPIVPLWVEKVFLISQFKNISPFGKRFSKCLLYSSLILVFCSVPRIVLANLVSTATVTPTVTWHHRQTGTRTPGWWKTATATKTPTPVNTSTGTRTPGTFTFTPTITSVPVATFTATAVPYESLENPRGLTAQVEGESVVLTWHPPSHGHHKNPSDYRIYRSSTPDGFYQQMGDLSVAGQSYQFNLSFSLKFVFSCVNRIILTSINDEQAIKYRWMIIIR